MLFLFKYKFFIKKVSPKNEFIQFSAMHNMTPNFCANVFVYYRE